MDAYVKYNGSNYGVVIQENSTTEKTVTFTTRGTFVVPRGVTSITVEVAGAGGGSNGHSYYDSSSDCCDCGEGG